jgi:hypothetical protein
MELRIFTSKNQLGPVFRTDGEESPPPCFRLYGTIEVQEPKKIVTEEELLYGRVERDGMIFYSAHLPPTVRNVRLLYDVKK